MGSPGEGGLSGCLIDCSIMHKAQTDTSSFLLSDIKWPSENRHVLYYATTQSNIRWGMK
ncbi:Protein CBG25542 [Caenorhabditis briggsae]|uniref:Protein CBG25542 n=1 Tax=Caenorhabditis briggsae TaxID=6238 RepID=B6IIR4_CAEBR|nr:Protein CBG25542 [Caenorhabditis briggsae]CAR99794.1 Protein CBG25542 [Caenorhabditis briggsae]